MTSITTDSPRLNMRSVTMKDIADRCGIHHSTVQRALAGSPEVNAETAERVLAIAAEMGYNPAHSEAARRLVNRRYGKTPLNQVIALYMPPDFARVTHFQRVFQGIVDIINAEQYDLLTIATDSETLNRPISRIIQRREVDGAIVFASGTVVERLRLDDSFADFPIVKVLVPSPASSGVLIDDFGGGNAAAGHLLDLGHRRILHFSETSSYNMIQRVAGYQHACAQRALDASACLIDYLPPWRPHMTHKARIAEALLAALAAHPGITAILLPNDRLVEAVMPELARLGLRVPEDISLVGFDDTDPLLNTCGENMLTTVALPLEDIGQEATRLLIARITGQLTTDRVVTLPVTLIVRGSTRAIRTGQ